MIATALVALLPVVPSAMSPAGAENAPADDAPAPEEGWPEPPLREITGFDPEASVINTDRVTPTEIEYVNPDGTRTVRVTPGPVRFRDASGEWRDIDLTLQPLGGAVSAAATDLAVSFNPVAAAPTVTVQTAAGPILVRHPEATGAIGTLDGRSIRYESGLTGGRHLVESAIVSGYEEHVVLPDAGVNGYSIEFLVPPGVAATATAVQGGVSFSGADGTSLFWFGGGYAFDSSINEAGLGAETPVVTELVSQVANVVAVRVSVSSEWLSAPERIFPVTIDPTGLSKTYNNDNCVFSGPFNSCDTYVNSDNFSGKYSAQTELRVGSPGACEQGTSGATCPKNRTRTYTRMASDNYYGYGLDILSSKVALKMRSTSSVTSASFTVRELTSAVYSSTSWSSQPSTTSLDARSTTVGTWPGWIEWDVTDMAKRWATADPATGELFGFGFFASDEYDPRYFRRFDSGETGSSTSPYWEYTYNLPPYQASPASPANGAVVTSRTPTITANAANDPDGNALTFLLELSTSSTFSNPSYPYGWTSTPSWSPTLADGTYYWRVHVNDGRLTTYANWSRSFRVDATGPAVNLSSSHSSGAWSKNPAFSASWSASDASGIDGYGVVRNTRQNFDPTTKTNEASATHHNEVLPDGNWWFHVRARDGVGNWGQTARVNARIDTTAPSAPPNLTPLTCHAKGVASSDDTMEMAWDPATDLTSGISNYTWAFNKAASKQATDATSEYWGTVGHNVHSVSSPVLPEGAWYFHVQSRDAAGNVGVDAVDGPYVVDHDSSACLTDALTRDLVAQSNEMGLEQFYPYDDHALGGDGRAFVNLGTRNLVAAFDTVRIPATGLNAVVRHVYNSGIGGGDSGISPGWTLSISDADAGLDVDETQADLAPFVVDPHAHINATELLDVVDGALTVTGLVLDLTDGDGTAHRFARNGLVGGEWTSPPGVNLRVREVLHPTTGLVVAYDFVRPDGVTYRAARVAPPDALSAWRIVSVTDRSGNSLSYEYEKRGDVVGVTRLVSVRHSDAGQLLTFSYDGEARLVRMTALPGVTGFDAATGGTRSYERWVSYTYDESGRLDTVVENDHLPAGDDGRRVTRYDYDSTSGALSAVIDGRNHVTGFSYEAVGNGDVRVTKVTDRHSTASNNSKAWLYGAATNPTTGLPATGVTTPLGATSFYEVSPRGAVNASDTRRTGGNITTITDAGTDSVGGRVTTSYEWTANRLVKRKEAFSAEWSYSYDDLGQLLSVTSPAPNTARAELPANAPTTPITSTLSYRYLGARHDGCDPAGVAGRCALYAELERVSAATNIPTQRRITDFTHDANGNPEREVRRGSSGFSGTPSDPPSAADRATANTFDANGRRLSMNGPRDGNDDETKFSSFDRTGQPTVVTDGNGLASTFVYSPYGEVLRVSDRDGRITTSVFDERGNRIRAIEPDLDTWSWRYDANDNATAMTTPRGNDTSTVDDFTTFAFYDERDLLTRLSEPGTAPDQRRLTEYGYDDDGRRTTETRPFVSASSQTTGSLPALNFGFTGGAQAYTVPAGVTSLVLEAWGAQGGRPGTANTANRGGYAKGTLAVSPGDVIHLFVGGQGGDGTASAAAPGGYNGGGAGGTPGVGSTGTAGGGGGATDFRVGGTALSHRVLVAGGGGGSGGAANWVDGGSGGGSAGGDGVDGTDNGFGSYGGNGGTSSAGGSGGTAAGTGAAGDPGSLGLGGKGGNAGANGWGGGGGGGGHFGGGGAGGGGLNSGAGAGGGGSAYLGGVTDGSTSGNVRQGNGQAVITPILGTSSDRFETIYTYWPNGSLRSVDRPGQSVSQRAVAEQFYDSAGRLRLVRGPANNASGSRPTTEVTYTPSGSEASRTETGPHTTNAVVQTAYNSHGEVIQVLGPRTASDSSGVISQQTTSAYNVFGEETERARRLTRDKWLTSSFGYDKAGNRVSVSQPTGSDAFLTTTYRYDGLARLVEQTADPSNPGHTVDFSYDGEGNQRFRVDKENGVARRTVENVYNLDGSLQRRVATDHTTGGRLAECNFAEGAGPDSGYDADGHPLASRTVIGTADCTSGTVVARETYSWDERGFMTASTQAVANAAGTLVSRDQTFTYNAAGDRTSLTHDGKTVTYGRAPAGWVRTIGDWHGSSSSASYFPSGALASRQHGTAASGSFDYFAEGSLASLAWTAGGKTVRTHSNFTYDVDGLKRVEQVDILRPGATTTTGGHANLSYDLAGRLASWRSPHSGTGGRWTTAYTLDDGGNVTRELKTDANGNIRQDSRFTYSSGRLARKNTEVPGIPLPQSLACEEFAYTGLGEERVRTTVTASVGSALVGCGPATSTTSVTTTYDSGGFVAATDGVSYLYSLDEKVLRRTEGSESTLHFYDPQSGRLIEETNAAGEMMAMYLLDGDGTAIAHQTHRAPNGARSTNGTWVWLLADPDGNVATHVDDAGKVLEQAAYEPYGSKDAAGTPARDSTYAGSRLGFQSDLMDAKTKKLLLGPRQYDPSTLRFTTPDTFVSSQLDLQLGVDELTGNRYCFAAANPVAFYEDGHHPRRYHEKGVVDDRCSKQEYDRAKQFSSAEYIRGGWMVAKGEYGRGIRTLAIGGAGDAGLAAAQRSKRPWLRVPGRVASRFILPVQVVATAWDISCTMYGWDYRKKSGNKKASLVK